MTFYERTLALSWELYYTSSGKKLPIVLPMHLQSLTPISQMLQG